MTPPAKKAAPAKVTSEKATPERTTPSLQDLVGDTTNQEPIVTHSTEDGTLEPVVVDENDNRDLDAEGNQRVETNSLPSGLSGKDVVVDYPTDGPVNKTWEENQAHNLGRLHPDAIANPAPLTQSTVAKTVYVTDYANPAELDDKGIEGPPEDELDPDSENNSDEYAPVNKNDDKLSK